MRRYGPTDLLPPDYIAALQCLQDDVAPIPFAAVHESVERELGGRLTKMFSSFDGDAARGDLARPGSCSDAA